MQFKNTKENIKYKYSKMSYYSDNKVVKGCPWWLVVMLLLAIAVLSGWGGYYYGSEHKKNTLHAVLIGDTAMVCTEDSSNMIASKSEEQKDSEKKKEYEAVIPNYENNKVESLTESEINNETTETKQAVDQYEQKDERVRNGSYRIVGFDREIKVQPGQTFYGICKANLGPDMECYVEVYNNLPRSPQIKAGQIIKIPKLQLKKRAK